MGSPMPETSKKSAIQEREAFLCGTVLTFLSTLRHIQPDEKEAQPVSADKDHKWSCLTSIVR